MSGKYGSPAPGAPGVKPLWASAAERGVSRPVAATTAAIDRARGVSLAMQLSSCLLSTTPEGQRGTQHAPSHHAPQGPHRGHHVVGRVVPYSHTWKNRPR